MWIQMANNYIKQPLRFIQTTVWATFASKQYNMHSPVLEDKDIALAVLHLPKMKSSWTL